MISTVSGEFTEGNLDRRIRGKILPPEKLNPIADRLVEIVRMKMENAGIEDLTAEATDPKGRKWTIELGVDRTTLLMQRVGPTGIIKNSYRVTKSVSHPDANGQEEATPAHISVINPKGNPIRANSDVAASVVKKTINSLKIIKPLPIRKPMDW